MVISGPAVTVGSAIMVNTKSSWMVPPHGLNASAVREIVTDPAAISSALGEYVGDRELTLLKKPFPVDAQA